MELRCLSSLDFLQLKDLLLEQKTFFGLPVSEFPGLFDKQVFTRLFINLVESKEEFVIGAFDREFLCGAVLLKLVPSHQLWVSRLVILRESLKGKSNGLHADLLDKAYQFVEPKGYFHNIMVVPEKYLTSKKTWDTPTRKKYTTENAEFVKARELPIDLIYREHLYANVPFPVNSIVRNATLLKPGQARNS